VSQFTLFAKIKGTKPDFHEAMPAAQSKDFYAKFVDKLRQMYKPELIKGNFLNNPTTNNNNNNNKNNNFLIFSFCESQKNESIYML
jgi:D-Tyr-tRNAtyr deacylase